MKQFNGSVFSCSIGARFQFRRCIYEKIARISFAQRWVWKYFIFHSETVPNEMNSVTIINRKS